MEGTMKAARLHGVEPDGASTGVIRVDEIPIPDIEEGEVLVRVLRAGLNHGDLHMRQEGANYTGETRALLHLPMTIGHDGLGEVVEVGPDVTNVKVGDGAVVMCSLTCGYCKYCRSERQHLCVVSRSMGFLSRSQGGPERLRRYKDGLWAEYCRVPATNLSPLRPEDDVEEMCKGSQMAVGYRALKQAGLHSGETVLINGGTGITGIGVVLCALAMGAAQVIVIARDPVRLASVQAIDPLRISTVALGDGESISETVRELTRGEGAGVLVDVAPAGAETMIECIMNLEAGGRVGLIGANPEPLNIPIRYLMRMSIQSSANTGRHYSDVPELLELVRRGVIDTRHVTPRFFPLEEINEALDSIEHREDPQTFWPMYAPSA